MIMRYGRVRSDPHKTGLSNYSLIFAVESIGVDGNRRKRIQHGATSQLLSGRLRESRNQWDPIDSKQKQLNWQQLSCTRKTIGADGNQRIGAQHGASSQHFPFVLGSIAIRTFKCLSFNFEASILIFQVSHLFPLPAESNCSKWRAITLNLLHV